MREGRREGRREGKTRRDRKMNNGQLEKEKNRVIKVQSTNGKLW